MTSSEAEEWVATAHRDWTNEKAASWAIVSEDVLLGRLTLRNLDLEYGLAEVAYWVTTFARGRGIAPRSLSTISTWAAHELGLHRLELAHSVDNPAPCRVA